MWITSCTGSVRGGFWGIWKKVRELRSCLRRKKLAFACSPKPGQWPCGGCHACWGGGRWKSQNRKNVYLFPYVEKPFNSKVIKSFVPELRSHKCFSCFGIPMFYVYMLWTFYVHFTYSCIAMLHFSWVCSNIPFWSVFFINLCNLMLLFFPHNLNLLFSRVLIILAFT